MRRSILPLFLLLSFTASAQHGLPHELAPEEQPLIPAYRDSRAGASRGISTPPAFPVRTMAEWEEVQAVVVTWTSYTGILKQIVRHAKAECEVIIVCDDEASVTDYLQNSQYGGPLPDLNNITFLVEDFNSIWCRDFGPETIYRNEVDSVMLLDWIYNRPRPLDDGLSDALAAQMGLPIYSTTQAPYDLVHTGGNFMADGFGTAFSSELVLNENGPGGQFNQTVKTEAQVDDIMEQFMGIEQGRYVKMTPLPFDAINHIDMHMKLIDEETLLIGEFPVGVSDGPTLETNIQNVLANYNSLFGTPYRIVRIPMPSSTGGNYPPSASYRTFANNIFLNKTILVPTYRDEYDTTGLRILRETLPGYNVVGIDCDNSDQNIISASGAIHCITKAIGVDDPLLISHQRLSDTYETVIPYSVEAYMRHRSGIANAQLYWTTDTTQGYAALPMTDQGSGNWAGAIPAQIAGTEVFYYVEGTSVSGKTQVRPIVAPEGWWNFNVLDISSGISEADGPSIVEVFPNPTSSLVMITLTSATNERVIVRLLDALGREVMRLHEGVVPNDNRVFADISALSEGAYSVVVESANGRKTARVLKR
ncbi:MAG: agmatine deiminase family protein [Flavobacteriales bacterium]|nr:agmatine deiminase family protein [Flavobacteriales bacterium]